MVEPATAAHLRREVARVRAAAPRGHFDSVLHLGRLGGHHLTCPLPAADRDRLDAGTRAEVATRMLEGLASSPGSGAEGGRHSAWLARTGDPVVQDDDLAWLAAATWACSALGHRLTGFWAVTRTGWLDVRTGEARTWKRLRLRWP